MEIVSKRDSALHFWKSMWMSAQMNRHTNDRFKKISHLKTPFFICFLSIDSSLCLLVHGTWEFSHWGFCITQYRDASLVIGDDQNWSCGLKSFERAEGWTRAVQTAQPFHLVVLLCLCHLYKPMLEQEEAHGQVHSQYRSRFLKECQNS